MLREAIGEPLLLLVGSGFGGCRENVGMTLDFASAVAQTRATTEKAEGREREEN